MRWQVLDQLKQQNRYQSLDVYGAIESEVIESEKADEPKALKQALSLLPPVEGQVLYLFYLEQMSVAKIARILEIPVGTVKSRLYRARKMFKQQLELEK